MLLALIVLPALAQEECPTTQAAPAVLPRRQGRVRNVVSHADGTATSENWGGYVVTGSAFTQAAGSWTVPAIDCSQTPNARAVFWVGIDGYGSGTVEQTGTGSICTGTTPNYYTWWAFYPTAGSALPNTPVSVSPGDQMSAQISYSDSQSQFTITITNETAQESYSCWYQPPLGAERTSAEWIAETPLNSSSGDFAPLADFGTVDFGQGYTNISATNNATNASTSGPISVFGTSVVAITMDSGGMIQGVPSILSPDGSSFTVTWDGADFSLSAPPSQTLINVVAGQSGTVSLSISPENGFSSLVNFACSGLPVGASCTFSPSSVTPNGTAATSSTLTINTTGTSGAMRLPTAPSHRPIYALLFPGLGMMAILGLTAPRKVALRRAWPTALLILLMAASGLASCGGGGHSSPPPPPTPPGTSTIYVTASSSGPPAISQTLPVTLVVTQ